MAYRWINKYIHDYINKLIYVFSIHIYIYIYIYGQAPGIPAPLPPPNVWSGREGGAGGGVEAVGVSLDGGEVLRKGVTRKQYPSQAINPIT